MTAGEAAAAVQQQASALGVGTGEAAAPARTLRLERLTEQRRALVDALAVATALGATQLLAGGPRATLLVYPVAVLAGLHGRGDLSQDGSRFDEARCLVAAATVAALVLLGAGALLGTTERVGVVTTLWGASLSLLAAGRLVAARGLAQNRANALPTLIVGAGAIGAQLAARLAREARHGLRPIGFIDAAGATAPSPLPLLGRIDELPEIVATTGARCVAFAFTALPDQRLVPVVRDCERLGLRVFVVPRLFETVGFRSRLRYIGSLPVNELCAVDPDGARFAIKHAIDRVGAALLVCLLLPLLLLIAVLVKVGSPGPVLFRQPRVGRDGREFVMFKFRTMRVAPGEPVLVALPPGCAPGGVEGADRRTRLGTWLRRSSLDELPQLLNVLRGDMSLIGPRPERPAWATEFSRRVWSYGDRHRVRSGITGLAQVRGLRGRTSVQERAELDNFYIENWSFWLDLKIALQTVICILTLRGE
ncbi:MAG TPA: exopolysaccharide biosynthesis polyprenyl glycosylphosphotransferase [Solirubrobacteraceae bacterium]